MMNEFIEPCQTSILPKM